MQKCCTLLQPATRKAYRRRLLVPAFILLFANISFAQNTKIDSLLTALSHSKEDTNKVNVLNAIGRELINIGKYDSAIKYATDAKTLAEKIEFKKGIAKAFYIIGLVYYYQGNYPEALKNCLQSLKISEEIGDKKGAKSCYNHIGTIYMNQGNYPEALKNLMLALKISEEMGSKKAIADTYNNIGIVYEYQLNYSEALKNYYQALKISEEIGDNQTIASCYMNIGNIYYYQDNYNSALRNYLLALKIREEEGEKVSVVASKINIGSVYIKQKNYIEASKYLLNSLQESKEIGAKDYLKECYNSLAELSEATRDYKSAYQYHKLYSEIKDSLLNENNSKQIAEMKTKYETAKKEKDNVILTKEKEIQAVKIEKQKAAIRYLVAGFSLLFVFSAIAFRLYSQKRQTAFRQQVSETELKALRSQMNPHFTFNVLNSIQYYMSENDMESAELYLEKFSALIRKILDQSRTPYITLEEEVNMLKLYMELEEMMFKKKFEYSLEIMPNLNPEKILIPGMVIQPIVENAIKHGLTYKKGEAIITISFSSHNSVLLCTITDNGIGRAAAEKMKVRKQESEKVSGSSSYVSAGMVITKERIKALSSLYNIELSCRTEDLVNNSGIAAGTRVTVEIPIKS